MEPEVVAPVPVPLPPTKAEGLGVLIEEGAVWPVSPVPFTDQIARQKEQADTHAEAYALARAREAKAAGGDGLTRAAYIILMVAAIILVIVVAAVSLQARFGGDETPEQAGVVVEESYIWS